MRSACNLYDDMPHGWDPIQPCSADINGFWVMLMRLERPGK
jgi:hypothetical protein